MGRQGAGGGGGRSVSSGGHSYSRSSGGHRIGSSSGVSRPRNTSSSSSFRTNSTYSSNNRNTVHTPYRGGSSYRPPFMPSYNGGYNNYNRPPRRNRYGMSTKTVIVIAVLLIFLVVALSMIANSNNPTSTSNREKLDTNIAFNNSCVLDELGWIDNASKTSKDLIEFYEDTGVQPMFYLKAYDFTLINDNDKKLYAEDWYENNVDNEITFLVMYFAEQDSDNEMGYFAYVCGKQAGSVMDAEAIDIFWNYLDSNWLSNKSMDKVISDSFISTGNRIMTKSTTGMDILKIGMVGFVVIIIVSGIAYLMILKRKHASEEAEETERILSTDINMSGINRTDEVLERYND